MGRSTLRERSHLTAQYPTHPATNAGRSFWVAVAGLLVVTFFAYSPALRGPQLLDDPEAIQANQSIRQLWPPSVPLQPPSQTAVAGRPVVNYSLALNYWLNDALGVDQRDNPDGPDKTVGYHVVNIVIHLACGLLILGIVRRTIAAGPWDLDANAVGLSVSALWLLHPLQTEAVNYLVQRTELLVSLFYLATLYCSIRAWNATTSRSRRGWSVGAIAVCLLGMGSKEVMVSAPLIVVLYDRAFRLESLRDLKNPARRARLWLYAGLATTWLLLVALMMSGPRSQSVGFRGTVTPMSSLEYLHSQGWAILRYLRLTFLPTALTIDYGSRPIAHWRGVPGLILLVATGIGTIVAWMRPKRWGWVAFLGSWFFLILGPSSSVVPIVTEIAAERRFYLPLAAVLVLIVIGIALAVRRIEQIMAPQPAPAQRLLVGGAVIVLSVVFGQLTRSRSALYRTDRAIWSDAVVHYPENPRAWNNLAVIVGNEAIDPTGRADPTLGLEQANAMYRKALALDPDYTDARFSLVGNILTLGDRAAAAAELEKVPVQLSNRLAGFGSTLLQHGDTADALIALSRAAIAPPNEQVLVEIGAIYMAGGHFDAAIPWLRRAEQMAEGRSDVKEMLRKSEAEAGPHSGDSTRNP